MNAGAYREPDYLDTGKRQTNLYPKSLFKDPPQSTGRLRELAWRSWASRGHMHQRPRRDMTVFGGLREALWGEENSFPVRGGHRLSGTCRQVCSDAKLVCSH